MEASPTTEATPMDIAESPGDGDGDGPMSIEPSPPATIPNNQGFFVTPPWQ